MSKVIEKYLKYLNEMKVVCAWCGAHLGEKEPKSNPSISHGICSACRRKFFSKG